MSKEYLFRVELHKISESDAAQSIDKNTSYKADAPEDAWEQILNDVIIYSKFEKLYSINIRLLGDRIAD